MINSWFLDTDIALLSTAAGTGSESEDSISSSLAGGLTLAQASRWVFVRECLLSAVTPFFQYHDYHFVFLLMYTKFIRP